MQTKKNPPFIAPIDGKTYLVDPKAKLQARIPAQKEWVVKRFRKGAETKYVLMDEASKSSPKVMIETEKVFRAKDSTVSQMACLV